jgi:hypothetical protein
VEIGTINLQFVSVGGSYDEYSAAVKLTIERGYVTMHPSGAYASFTLISSRSSPKGWNRPFDEPIPVPCGGQLVTFERAHCSRIGFT